MDYEYAVEIARYKCKPYYTMLLFLNIYKNFFNSDKNCGNYVPIFNPGLKVKWVTYQSPTSGFAIKLQSGEYFKGFNMWHEFVDKLMHEVPSRRVY